MTQFHLKHVEELLNIQCSVLNILKPGVKTLLRKSCHKLDAGQTLKSHKIGTMLILSTMITAGVKMKTNVVVPNWMAFKLNAINAQMDHKRNIRSATSGLFAITAADIMLCVGPKRLRVHHPWCRLCLSFGPLRSSRIFLIK